MRPFRAVVASSDGDSAAHGVGGHEVQSRGLFAAQTTLTAIESSALVSYLKTLTAEKAIELLLKIYFYYCSSDEGSRTRRSPLAIMPPRGHDLAVAGGAAARSIPSKTANLLLTLQGYQEASLVLDNIFVEFVVFHENSTGQQQVDLQNIPELLGTVETLLQRGHAESINGRMDILSGGQLTLLSTALRTNSSQTISMSEVLQIGFRDLIAGKCPVGELESIINTIIKERNSTAATENDGSEIEMLVSSVMTEMRNVLGVRDTATEANVADDQSPPFAFIKEFLATFNNKILEYISAADESAKSTAKSTLADSYQQFKTKLTEMHLVLQDAIQFAVIRDSLADSNQNLMTTVLALCLQYCSVVASKTGGNSSFGNPDDTEALDRRRSVRDACFKLLDHIRTNRNAITEGKTIEWVEMVLKLSFSETFYNRCNGELAAINTVHPPSIDANVRAQFYRSYLAIIYMLERIQSMRDSEVTGTVNSLENMRRDFQAWLEEFQKQQTQETALIRVDPPTGQKALMQQGPPSILSRTIAAATSAHTERRNVAIGMQNQATKALEQAVSYVIKWCEGQPAVQEELKKRFFAIARGPVEKPVARGDEWGVITRKFIDGLSGAGIDGNNDWKITAIIAAFGEANL